MVLDEARKQGYKVIDIRDNMATGENVNQRLREALMGGPVFILGSGHGHSSEFTGHALDPIFDMKTNIDLMGSPVYLMSCKTGAGLGRYLVEKCNASAFLGYDKSYYILSDSIAELEFDPAVQSYMQMFMVPALTLIWGGSMEDGMNNAIRTHDAWRSYYEDRILMGCESSQMDRVAIGRLSHDIDALTMYGDDVYIGQSYNNLRVEPVLPQLNNGVGYIKIKG
tara:strand:+ start:9242 stop:9913 length:672 start_codon:yes stop_codon:yes gene_type:complete